MTQTSALDRWLEKLEARAASHVIALGLERVQAVRERLPATTDAVVITVAGTNGKGSTCALLEAMLRAGGYRVGCYTSPHLLRYNERVRLDGQPIGDEALLSDFEAVEAVRGEVPLTYFEHGTLAAWVAFCREPLDAIILEVGMGGRLDATNVFDADAAILTGVALDHQAYLGPDREAIGREKAGIFRPERPAIVADPVPPRSVLETAAALGAELYRIGVDFGYDGDRQQWRWWSRAAGNRGGLPYPALRGVNQLMNASAALMALTCLRDRLPLAMQAVREGLMTVELPGRFQVLPGRPSVILDVAHNPQAAAVLAENLAAMPGYRRTLAVVGMLADKDVEGVARILASRVDAWFAAGLHGPRALTAEALAARLESVGVATQGTFSSVTEALAAAQAQARDDDRIVVFGSFLTVADALRALHVQDTESR